MQSVYLFDLAFQRAQWLTARQTAVAENVVNANTPNYRARDVEPFEKTLDRTELGMAATDPRHISFAPAQARASAFHGSRLQTTASDVSLENELIKAGEVSRDYTLDVSIVKTFHRMWMASLKG